MSHPQGVQQKKTGGGSKVTTQKSQKGEHVEKKRRSHEGTFLSCFFSLTCDWQIQVNWQLFEGTVRSTVWQLLHPPPCDFGNNVWQKLLPVWIGE